MHHIYNMLDSKTHKCAESLGLEDQLVKHGLLIVSFNLLKKKKKTSETPQVPVLTQSTIKVLALAFDKPAHSVLVYQNLQSTRSRHMQITNV